MTPSPAGTLLRHVRTWLAGRTPGAPDAAHDGYLESLAVAPAGLVTTAGRERTVRLWDAATGV